MNMQSTLEQKLAAAIPAQHLEIINESSNHNVPPGSESHFKVILVSEEFADQSPVQRHRRVNKILAEELAGQIHALALHTYTPSEWQEKHGNAPMSPPCLGGSKAKIQ